MLRLDNSFYNRHVVDVAKNLLGKTLVFGKVKGIITTEAYRGATMKLPMLLAGHLDLQ